MNPSPRVQEIIADRERSYRGDTGSLNTVAELLALKQSGYLLGGDAEGTPRDWTSEESSDIKHAYRYGHHREILAQLFPGECNEVASEPDQTRAGVAADRNECSADCFQEVPL